MRSKIFEMLQYIEEKHNVKVIYACESGSRAWGFESKNSDYDVRFIYVHPLDWYLSVGEKKDIIELPADDELDINGWDIRKSLALLRKSNPVILEWLASPIKYCTHALAVAALVELARKAFMPESSCHHYLVMAKNTLAQSQIYEKVKIKSYLYATRPVLCCRWIAKYKKQAPMLIDDLIAEFLPDQNNELRQYIDHIIRIKKESDEGVGVDRSTLLDNFLHSQFAELENLIPKNPPKLCVEEFDSAFRQIVKLEI